MVIFTQTPYTYRVPKIPVRMTAGRWRKTNFQHSISPSSLKGRNSP